MVSLRCVLIIIVNISVLQASKMSNTKLVDALSPSDPSSFSRPEECFVRKLHLSLNLDFTNKIVSGKVDLEVEKRNPNVAQLILDSKGLHILSVEKLHEGTSLDYEVSPEIEPFGSKLSISLPKTNATVFNVRIKYETSPDASGLQWLKPNQTLDKEMPFVFSQFQAVHARSVLPCQDTPAVKAPYTADISVPQGITVLMSAIRVGEPVVLMDKRVRYEFEQKVPIPSYLIAIAGGKLESRKLGERSHVWAEPSMIERAAYEFAETDEMLKTAEDICGPYVWGIYDLLVLPPSFPFGGMENPCLTFVTPTLIAGDRSLALVVAHEIAHSWTGNLVTNRNFEHFWLNEGFTVFTERKIAGRMKGHKVQDFEALSGVNILQETVQKMGEKSPLTKLVLDLRGVHPDDSFSSVPYEKGSIFLRYLENVVGGPEKFEPFLKDYLNKYKYKSIDTDDFQNSFTKWFHNTEETKEIDWNRWLNSPGMPPVIPKYDKTLANACTALKDKWANWDCEKQNVVGPNDLKDMDANQISYFLQLIFELDPMPISKLEKMENLYKLNSMNNLEIKFRWIRIGLKAHWMPRVDDALQLVTEVGRMKYIRPLYQDLYKWEQVRERAIDTFKKNRQSMMHVSAYTVKQDLHLDD